MIFFTILLSLWTQAETALPEFLDPLQMKEPKEVKQVDEGAFVVGGIVEFPVYSFYLGSPKVDGKAYVPNIPVRVGPRIMYKKFGVRATFGLSLPEREITRRGETEQSNFVFSFYWRQHAFDFYYQSFTGLYLGSPLVELERNRPNRYTQFPDAQSQNWGFNWYYNVNPGEFSLSSAFDQSEFKIEAGSGYVLIPFYRHWSIDLGQTILVGTDPDDASNLPDFAAGTFDTLGGSIAYARTWLYRKFYFSGLFGLGPALQFQEYFEDGREKDELTPAVKLNVNFSIGTKRDSYTAGVNFILDSIYSRVASLDVYSSFASAEVFVNHRF